MRLKKLGILLTIAILSLAMVLTACSNEGAASTDDSVTSTKENKETGTADDGSLQRVLDAGKIAFVGSGGYPPFNYFDDDGNVVGFDVDVGQEIADRLGVELNYVTSDWDGLVEGLRNKRYDGILGSMAITEERQQVVSFTDPYYYSGAQLVVRNDSRITTPSEMNGKTIAVATGTNYVSDAENLGAEVSLYQDDNATALELISGRVDGVITDRLVALTAMSEISGGEGLELCGKILRLEEMGIAINQDDTSLLEKINQILADMHKDGTLTAISEKWHGADITVK